VNYKERGKKAIIFHGTIPTFTWILSQVTKNLSQDNWFPAGIWTR